MSAGLASWIDSGDCTGSGQRPLRRAFSSPALTSEIIENPATFHPSFQRSTEK